MPRHNGAPIIRDEAKMDGNGCPIQMCTANSMQAIKKTLVPFDLSPFSNMTGAAAGLRGGRIKVMRRNDNSKKVLETVVVPDGKVDFDATRNLPEIEALVKRLHEIVIEDERKNPDNPVSIGIISPFRAQVEQLKISVSKVLSEHMMGKHQIEIGTAHTFQGDERDIILISWAYANNSFPQSKLCKFRVKFEPFL